MPHWTRERERLDKIWQAKKGMIKSTVTTLTGPSYKMAVLLDLMERYPDKFLPGTDYVASFGIHDDFPGYTPLAGTPASPAHVLEGTGDRATAASIKGAPGGELSHDRGGCHKTEMTHSEQITDTSSLNMFYNDELFTSMVLGTNFFRVAGLESTFAAPPLCRHDPDAPASTQTKGWTPANAAVEEVSRQQPFAVATVVDASSSTSTHRSTADADPHPTSVSSWLVGFVLVAGAAGLAGMLYITGRTTRAKAGNAEAMPYRLQTGDKPLLADA